MMIPTTLMGQADASSAGKTCKMETNKEFSWKSICLCMYIYNIHILKTANGYSADKDFPRFLNMDC